MTEDEVQATLNWWLAEITGQASVIDANSDRTRPDLPYLSSNLILSGPVRQNAIEDEFPTTGSGANEVIRQVPVQTWFWRFSVFAYGGKPTSLLRPVHAAAQVPTAHVKLLPLTLHEVSGIRNVPEVTENEVERRANMDIELRGLVRDGFVIDVAESFIGAPVDIAKV